MLFLLFISWKLFDILECPIHCAVCTDTDCTLCSDGYYINNEKCTGQSKYFIMGFYVLHQAPSEIV